LKWWTVIVPKHDFETKNFFFNRIRSIISHRLKVNFFTLSNYGGRSDIIRNDFQFKVFRLNALFLNKKNNFMK
jgi:hypothetical protein